MRSWILRRAASRLTPPSLENAFLGTETASRDDVSSATAGQMPDSPLEETHASMSNRRGGGGVEPSRAKFEAAFKGQRRRPFLFRFAGR